LTYLYLQIEQQTPDALQFISDFEVLAEGSRLDTSQLTAEVAQIAGAIRRIEKKLKDDASAKSPRMHSKQDQFDKKMSAFLKMAKPKYEELQSQHDETKNACTALAEYFGCQNDIKFEFMKDLYEFSVAVKHTGTQIKKQREREAKEQKNLQIKAARQERLKKKNRGGDEPTPPSAPQGKRKSSSRTNRVYSQNKLNKKRSSLSANKSAGIANTESAGMDSELMKIMQRQKTKTGGDSANKNKSYAERRQSRQNSRSQQRKRAKSPHSLRAKKHELTVTRSHTDTTNGMGPASPIDHSQPSSPAAQKGLGGLVGLPPPPEVDEDDYVNGAAANNAMLVGSPITESVVDDIKLSEIQNRRKVSSQITRNKNKSRSNASNSNQQPEDATKKKKWFGF